MSRRDDAPRDLLFGLLALQNGMITRDQLLSAFAIWTADRRPLADLLVEQGSLPDTRRALLDALVSEHLSAHDNDPESSLHDIPIADSVREAIASLAGDGLADTLRRAGSSERSTDPDPTVTHVPLEPADESQRFRKIYLHKKGGLGLIFFAIDNELKRSVAVKEIKEDCASDKIFRSRLRVEAEITGALEHPNIVPVYGVGTNSRGEPYYAMRFLKEKTLAEEIESVHDSSRNQFDRSLKTQALRKLLGRFVDVCNAIEYAHSRKVINRDIKPKNVILGSFGETIVIDWGLAKYIGAPDPAIPEGAPGASGPSSGEGLTDPLATLGTVGYMSPEQANRQYDRVGPASDIYSLGVMLFKILTNRLPQGPGDKATILRRTIDGDLNKPRAIDPSIDPALEAICMKALALKPEDRYPTCLALADDIDCWLADEPVSAYPEPLPRRAGRWVRRHTGIVASSGAMLTTAVVALFLSTWLISQEKERTEKWGTMARRAVDELLREVARTDLVGIPKLEPVRVAMADKALGFYKNFAEASPDDPDIQFELAIAEEQAASLFRMMGKFERAREGYKKAISILRSLIASRNSAPKHREYLAHTESQYGDMLRQSGKPISESEPHFREAVKLAEELQEANPDEPRYQSLAARSLGDLVSLLSTCGRDTEAEPLAARAVEHARKFDATLPGRFNLKEIPRRHFIMPMALGTHGGLLVKLKRGVEAEVPLREAIRRFKKLYEAYPFLNDAEYLAANTLEELANAVALDMRRLHEALTIHDESVQILTSLVERYAAVMHYPRALAEFRTDRAETRLAAGQLDGAQEDLDHAIAFLKDRVSSEPKALEPLQQLGRVTGNLGRLEARRGNKAAARERFVEAIRLQREALKIEPGSNVDAKFLTRHTEDLESMARP